MEPKNKKKVTRGDTTLKTYYLKKDILHLAHEPLLEKFRSFAAYAKRMKKVVGKRKWSEAERLQKARPAYSLEHLVRERYPRFCDALADLDDALCMIFLFAALPSQIVQERGEAIENGIISKQHQNTSQVCQRLADEFMLFVTKAKALRKAFISIKGIYYQAEMPDGTCVNWIVPHKFPQAIPSDVDFRVMNTFLEFYITLLGFVNCRLFKGLHLVYPPKAVGGVSCGKTGLDAYALEEEQSVAKQDIPVEIAPTEEEASSKSKQLFEGKVFFVGREVPRTAVEFVIRAFGGTIAGWQGEETGSEADAESNPSINYQLIDRPKLPNAIHLGRFYVQPQFVFDCVNAGKLLTNTHDYAPGAVLPPHLSPFVVGRAEGGENDEDLALKRPSNAQVLDELQQEAAAEAAEEVEQVEERKKMAASMLSKKTRKLYEHLTAGGSKH